MTGLKISIKGDGIPKLEEAAEALGSERKARNAFRRAINEAGRDTKTPTKRALAKQTGLKISVAGKALKETKASASTLEFKLTGQGGDIALKYFGARETRAGVSAAPFGQRDIFQGAFIKGGRFPNRVDIGKGGHVFERGYRVAKLPIAKVKSGVVIPDEMVKGITAQTFQRIGQSKLGEKVARHVRLVTKGVLT